MNDKVLFRIGNDEWNLLKTNCRLIKKCEFKKKIE